MKTVTLIAITMLLVPWTASAGGSTVWLDANFDSHPLGPIGSGGAESGEPVTSPFGYTSDVVAGSTSNELEFCDANSSFIVGMQFKLLGLDELTEGIVCVEWTITFPQFDQYVINILDRDGPLFHFFQIKFLSNGQMAFYDDNNVAPSYASFTYDTGTPMDFYCEFDMDTGLYDVWVDDVQLVDDEDHGITGEGIGAWWLQAGFDFNQGDCVQIDNLRITQTLGATAAPVDLVRSQADFQAPYPNPSGGMSFLPFDLYADGEVSMHIYDLAGRRVRTIAHGPELAGSHILTWDGRDGSGREAPHGTYFAKLRSGDTVQTRKIQLLR